MGRRRCLVVAFCAALVLGLATPASAQTQDTDPIPARVVRDLLGVDDDRPVRVTRTGGMIAYSIRLNAEERADLARQSRAKNQRILTAGRSLSSTGSTTSSINGPVIRCTFDYYYWFGAMNLDANDKSYTVTRSLSGPGSKMNRSSSVTFEGNTVAVFTETTTHEVGDDNPGTYTYKASAKGGPGKTKDLFLATGTGC